jgi:hypothetical protein
LRVPTPSIFLVSGFQPWTETTPVMAAARRWRNSSFAAALRAAASVGRPLTSPRSAAIGGAGNPALRSSFIRMLS